MPPPKPKKQKMSPPLTEKRQTRASSSTAAAAAAPTRPVRAPAPLSDSDLSTLSDSDDKHGFEYESDIDGDGSVEVMDVDEREGGEVIVLSSGDEHDEGDGRMMTPPEPAAGVSAPKGKMTSRKQFVFDLEQCKERYGAQATNHDLVCSQYTHPCRPSHGSALFM